MLRSVNLECSWIGSSSATPRNGESWSSFHNWNRVLGYDYMLQVYIRSHKEWMSRIGLFVVLLCHVVVIGTLQE